MFENAPIIHRYTRAQAIADGTLVDVTDVAKESGFTIPVAMTATAHAEVTQPLPDQPRDPELIKARLAEVFSVLHLIIALSTKSTDRVPLAIEHPGGVTHLYALCGPGDDAEPVLTIMLVGED